MNLIKAQRLAEGLPMPKLTEYANGLNPRLIPPWLATGVMMAKTDAEELEETMAGAAQGEQPSVKEQVEQKAGLFALQQAQQQAQAQQMMQPRMGAGPVPTGTPQPRPQPQPTGLDQLPSNLQMAGGGIVAFNGEDGDSEVEGKKKLRQVTQRELAEEYNRKRFGQLTAEEQARYDALLSQIPTDGSPTVTGGERVEGSELGRNIQNTAMALPGASAARAVSGSAGSARGLMAALAALVGRGTPADQPVPNVAGTPVADAETEKLKRLAATPKPPMGQGVNTSVSPNLVPANLRPIEKPPVANANPNAPRPAVPAAPAATAAPAPDSFEAMFRTSLENGPKERTVQEQLDEQNAIRKGAGLDEPAGKAQLERIAALNKQYESTKPTGLQELIQMFGQAGQSKGLSGLAPAYTNIETQKRAADLAHAKSINELMGGVETTQRGEKTQFAKDVTAGREKDLDRTSQFSREKMQTLGQVTGSKYNADMHYKQAMAQLGAAEKRADMTEKRDLMNAFKMRIAAIDRELVPLEKSFQKADRDLAAGYRAEKAGLTKALDEASGISKIMPAPSATSPSGNRPPLSSFQR